MEILVVAGAGSLVEGVRAALLTGGDETTIDVVYSPRAALAWLEEEPGRFGVVVADADTAPVGGFALARDVKAHEQLGETMPPVVLLLARSQDEWLAQWSGADAWSLKPPDPFDLADVVRAVASGEEAPARPGIGYGGGPMREEARRIEREGASGPQGGLTGGGP